MTGSALPTESALDKAVQEFGLGTYDFPQSGFDHGEDSEDLPSEKSLKGRALPDGGGPEVTGPDRLLSYPETFAADLLPGDYDRPPKSPRPQDDTLQSVVPTVSQAKLPSDEDNPSARSDYYDHMTTGQLRDEPWADEDSGAWATESEDSLPGVAKNDVNMEDFLGALGNAWSGHVLEDVTGPYGFPSTELSENADFPRSDMEDGGRLMASGGKGMIRKATNFELVGRMTDGVLKEYGKKGLTRRHVMAWLTKEGQPQFLASDVIRCLRLRHSVVVKDVLDEFPVAKTASYRVGLDPLTERIIDAAVLCRDDLEASRVLRFCAAAVSRAAGLSGRIGSAAREPDICSTSISLWAEPGADPGLTAAEEETALRGIEGAMQAVGASVDWGSDACYITFDDGGEGPARKALQSIMSGAAGPEAQRLMSLFTAEL